MSSIIKLLLFLFITTKLTSSQGFISTHTSSPRSSSLAKQRKLTFSTTSIMNDNISYNISTNDLNMDSNPSDVNSSKAIFTEENLLRFSGVGRLYQNDYSDGQDLIINQLSTSTKRRKNDGNNNSNMNEKLTHVQVVEKLAKSTVAIVGIGGVGSWSAESLCRSGIGHIILVDLDDICISNTNRQIHALSSSVGKLKIDEMKRRLIDINPFCNVTLIHDFVSVNNVDDIVSMMLPNVDVILDCIDGQDEKSALIASASIHGIPIMTCGGAAGRIDPTKIVCDDLSRAADCRLLFACKKILRDKYKLFTKGPSEGNIMKYRPRKWNVYAVFSTEIQKSVPRGAGADTSSLRRCDGSLGTACFLTGTYGFVAAAKIISMIVNNELKKPRILKSSITLYKDMKHDSGS